MTTLAERLRPLRRVPDAELASIRGVKAEEERQRREYERQIRGEPPLTPGRSRPPVRVQNAGPSPVAGRWEAMAESGRAELARDAARIAAASRSARFADQVEEARRQHARSERIREASAARDRAGVLEDAAAMQAKLAGSTPPRGDWARMTRDAQEDAARLVTGPLDPAIEAGWDPDTTAEENRRLGPAVSLGATPRGR
jgi:hypothetical protein